MDDSAVLADLLQIVLTRLNVTYALCYGSLWGALRVNRMLPWDNDLDFCILKEDLNRHDDFFVHRAFRNENLGIMYDTRQVCVLLIKVM